MATLAPNDPFARRMVSWFEKLDNLDPLKRPGQPTKPDVRGKDEQLNASVRRLTAQQCTDGRMTTSNHTRPTKTSTTAWNGQLATLSDRSVARSQPLRRSRMLRAVLERTRALHAYARGL